MQITVVDPADAQALSEICALEGACYAADGRRRPPSTLAETRVEWTCAFPGSQIVPLQARAGGVLAGCALADLTVVDNTANAFVSVMVHPDLRRRGAGTALAQAMLQQLRERGREVVIGRALTGGPGEFFAAALDAVRQQDTLFSVQDLERIDRPALAARQAAAAAQAAGYTLTRIAGPVPPELLPAMASMYKVMNDAPRESSAFEDEHWPPERVSQGDRWRMACGERLYSLLAFQAGTGEVAAMTRVAVRHQADMAGQLARPSRRRTAGTALVS